MHLSNGQNYAISAAALLAENEKARLSCKAICRRADIPERFVMTVMRKLVQAGLIEGKLGASGGYLLSRPAESVTLLDIIEAVEGRLDGDLNAQVSGICDAAQSLVATTVEQAVGSMRARLAATTLAHLRDAGAP